MKNEKRTRKTAKIIKSKIKIILSEYLKLWIPAKSLLSTSWDVEIKSSDPMNSLLDRSRWIVGWVSCMEAIIFNCKDKSGDICVYIDKDGYKH